MTQSAQQTRSLITIGRSLLAFYFLVPGVLKFLAFPMHVEMMTLHKIPSPAALLIVAGSAQVLGAILLLANRFARFNALAFVLYILVINVMMHDFWNFSGAVAAHETQNFIKNLGILAGLLVLAGISPRRPLVPMGLLQSDHAFVQNEGLKPKQI
jgi:putative oxidoreductase